MKKKWITFGLIAALSAGALAGCGGTSQDGSGKEQEVVVESGKAAAFQQAIQEAYGEDYLPNSAFDEASFTQKFGVSMDDVNEFVAEIPMVGTYADTLVIVEAKEGKVTAVEEALKAYREALVADTMQYPMNLAKINASTVYTKGNYVFFIMLGAIDETSETEEAQLEFAKTEIQKAIDAIDGAIA